MKNWSDQWFDSWRGLVSNQPWQSVLEDWWQGYSKQQGSSPTAAVFEKIAAQSHSFFKLAEELSRAEADDKTPDAWKALEKTLSSLGQGFSDPDGSAAKNLFWQMPMNNWQQAMSAMSGTPPQWLAVPGIDASSNMAAGLNPLLSMPGLGYTRESQADFQKLARLALAYREAQQRYSDLLVKMNAESLDMMRQRLAERAENDGEPIDSVRHLYDLWVACSEEVYAKHALTDDFATLNGELVNALMALKQHGARMSDSIAGDLNLPTRREIDTLHQRFHAERKAAKEKGTKLTEVQNSNNELAEQLQELKKRMSDLERGKAKPSGKTTGPRAGSGTAGRKRTTRSKKPSVTSKPGK